MEGRGFRDKIQDFSAKNAQVLGVSFDTIEENAKFAEKFQFPYPLLCDTDRKIGVDYGAAENPSASNAKRITYLIDENGVIKKVYGKVTPAAHPDEILSAL